MSYGQTSILLSGAMEAPLTSRYTYIHIYIYMYPHDQVTALHVELSGVQQEILYNLSDVILPPSEAEAEVALSCVLHYVI